MQDCYQGCRAKENKQPLCHESFVDRCLLSGLSRVHPLLRRHRVTPNMLTTVSLLFGFVAVLAIWVDNLTAFVVFQMLNYVFDCLDGQHARRYDMVTKWGDWYDRSGTQPNPTCVCSHVTDLIVQVLILFSMLYKWSEVIRPIDLFLMVAGYILRSQGPLAGGGTPARPGPRELWVPTVAVRARFPGDHRRPVLFVSGGASGALAQGDRVGELHGVPDRLRGVDWSPSSGLEEAEGRMTGAPPPFFFPPLVLSLCL